MTIAKSELANLAQPIEATLRTRHIPFEAQHVICSH